MKTFHWDFFGPRAEFTAQHFKRHLDGFLAEHFVTECSTGMMSEGAMHRAVFCRPSAAWEERIQISLRPNRITDES